MAYATAPAGLLGRLRVLALQMITAASMMIIPSSTRLYTLAAVQWTARRLLSKQRSLLAPKTNKIRQFRPGCLWSTHLGKARKKRRSPNFSAAGCLAKAPTANIAHLSHSGPLLLLLLAMDAY